MGEVHALQAVGPGIDQRIDRAAQPVQIAYIGAHGVGGLIADNALIIAARGIIGRIDRVYREVRGLDIAPGDTGLLRRADGTVIAIAATVTGDSKDEIIHVPAEGAPLPQAGEALRVLDVGCGSGILSIAALLFGAKSTYLVDIDALAVKTAIQNGEINKMVPPRYQVVQGNLAEKVTGKYDIIVANIVADAIVELSKDIPTFLNDNGIYIVSGIIDNRERDVADRLHQLGFQQIQRMECKGWLCMVYSLEQKGSLSNAID